MLKRLIGSPFFGYLVAVFGIAFAASVTLLVGQLPRPGSAIIFLYLIVILTAAWMGYGAGLLACFLAFGVLPRLFFPALSPVDGSRFALTLLTAILMSGVAATRRRLERRLKDENQRLEAGIRERTAELSLIADIIESSEDAIVSKTLDGTIRTWNAAAERIYGYSAAEAVGKSIAMLLPADRLGEESDILKRIVSGDRVEHFETIRVRKDGQPIHVSLTISPVHDTDGRLVAAAHIARDITQRMQFEQQLRQHPGANRAVEGLADNRVFGRFNDVGDQRQFRCAFADTGFQSLVFILQPPFEASSGSSDAAHQDRREERQGKPAAIDGRQGRKEQTRQEAKSQKASQQPGSVTHPCGGQNYDQVKENYGGSWPGELTDEQGNAGGKRDAEHRHQIPEEGRTDKAFQHCGMALPKHNNSI